MSASALYSVDTSALIDGLERYYPEETFPALRPFLVGSLSGTLPGLSSRVAGFRKYQIGILYRHLKEYRTAEAEWGQAGECDLQQYSFDYGKSSSRFSEPKGQKPNKDFGPLIRFNGNRCINCTRCVRFSQEISGGGEIGQVNRGDHNIVDSVEYIVSRAWADPDGDDRVGVVMCQDGQIFAAREVQKADARPGGYIATGGHGAL